jgi:hypothetical protein
MVWAVLALAAVGARAQAQDQVNPQPKNAQAGATQPPQPGSAPASPQQGQVARGSTSDAFDRACVDMLHGQMPSDPKAIKVLRDACASVMAGRADERLEAERRRQEQLAAQEQLRAIAEGRVQPGTATTQPEAGQGVLAAFEQAGRELTGSRPPGGMGMRRGGPVGYMLVTNPVGWFSGLGINAELWGVFRDAPKFSWVAGARYSVTDASNGTASTFGVEGGADWFIIGRNNEGLRLGPRVEFAAGREHFQGNTTFARMGLGGEVGYNFIASNGISGNLALGLGGRVAGDSQNDSFASFVGGEFGPYAKIGVGFSW